MNDNIKKVIKIILAIIGWGLTVFFVLLGISSLAITKFHFSGIFLLLIAVMCCPFIKKMPFKIFFWIRCVSGIIFFVLWVTTYPIKEHTTEEEQSTIQETETQESVFEESVMESEETQESAESDIAVETAEDESMSESEESMSEEESEETEKSKDDTEWTEDEFKENCEEVPYEELARYPDTYKGAMIKINIKVSKVQAGKWVFTDSYLCKVAGTDNNIALADMRKTKEPKLLEGDSVTVYGYANGLTEMTETKYVLGREQNTEKYMIPRIDIEYVEIK